MKPLKNTGHVIDDMEKSLLKKKNFIVRTLTAVILGPLVLGLLSFGSPYSSLVVLTITIAALYEWAVLSHSQKIWWVGGSIYILLSLLALTFCLQQYQIFFFMILLTTWMTDIGAYLIGSKLQGPKIVPKISPGKTWTGTIGGHIVGVSTFMGLSSFLPLITSSSSGMSLKILDHTPLALFVFSNILVMMGQGGDLLESYAKRHFGVKDSGKMLPGHGGLLDRIDSILAIGFFLFWYQLYAFQGNIQIYKSLWNS